MALGLIADDVATDLLNLLVGRARYASLHFDLPTQTDPSATELFDPGYARQRISWTFESTRAITTATALTFPAVDTTNIPAIGLWGDQVGGAFAGYSIPQPGQMIYVPSLSAVLLPAGELSIRIP